MGPKTATILIVDDEEPNREIIEDQIRLLGHRTLVAENGLSALAQVEKHSPDLVLLDIMMPEMDGHQVLERMKSDSKTHDIPVIVISALDDMNSVIPCIRRGADDYLVKPFKSEILKARVASSLEKKWLRDQKGAMRAQLQEYNLRLEDRVHEQVKQIALGHLGTIFAMSKLAESRDPETGEHLDRMREYCRILTKQLTTLPRYGDTIDKAYVDNIFAASPLHDIGKVGIPDRILLKPGKLTNEEFDITKTHAAIGADALRAISHECPDNEFVGIGIEIAESHHEKWDGSGYPHGLSGEDIPLAGRILALGDVYDALTSKRCYKDAFTHEKSKDIILEGRGGHFDPDVVDAFVATENEFLAVRERIADSDKEAD